MKPLKDRMDDWTPFEVALFNLVTTDGGTGLLFSKRLMVTEAMIEGFHRKVAELKADPNTVVLEGSPTPAQAREE